MTGIAAARWRDGPVIALLLVGFAVAAVCTGWLRQSVLHEPVVVAVDLREARLPLRHVRDLAYAVDLGALSVSPRGDVIGDAAGPQPLSVQDAVVVEDGAPLTRAAWPDQVVRQPGCFLLQGTTLLVSASDSGNPAENGRRYGLAFQVPRWSLRAGDPFQAYAPYLHRSNALLPAALAAAATFGLAVALAWKLAAAGSTARLRRLVGAVSFVAVFAGLAVEARVHWNDVIVGYDTESYMEPAANSFRPPGFALFARATTSHPGPATFHAYPKERRVVGDQGDDVLRLVRAEKLFAGLSLLVFGLALCLVLPAPVAAALVLGLGNAASAVPVLFGAPIYRMIAAAVAVSALVSSLAFGWRSRGARRWRPATAVAGVLAAITASGMALEYGAFADFLDWAMSETVAEALGLLTLAAALAYLFAGWRGMLTAAATGAALMCLTRQAAPFYWVVVLGLLPAAFRHDRRIAGRQTAIVVTLFLASTVGLYVVMTFASRAIPLAELHRIAFALFIADASDAAEMPDDGTRAFFAQAMTQRDQMIGAGHDRPRGIARHFYGLGLDIALPTAIKVARLQGAAEPESTARALMARAAGTVLARHYDRYLRFVAGSFAEIAGMMRAGSRLLPWWLVAAATGVGIALVRGLHGYFAALLVLAAVAGYVLIAVASGPIERLVYPIDTLWFLASLVLALGAWQRVREPAGRPT